MDNDIVFEDPPPNGAGAEGVWSDLLAPLRERPGEWARVRGPLTISSAGSTAGNLKNGKYAGCPKGDYEAVSRQVDGKAYVWARYVGADQ
jgi:hypothetical protein